jgi:hypothetical protein
MRVFKKIVDYEDEFIEIFHFEERGKLHKNGGSSKGGDKK